MTESRIHVAHREDLIYLLAEAAELEHGIMCCYLFAAFSLKLSESEGVNEEELAAIGQWRKVINDVAREEMLHLGLVANIMSAIGAAPRLSRPNLPLSPGEHPSQLVLELARFDEATLDHFIFMERPEESDIADGQGFESDDYERDTPRSGLMPGGQEFATIGELYRGIRQGLRLLCKRYGERAVFCGSPRAQVGSSILSMEGFTEVADLRTAERAIDLIVTQGEGVNSPHVTSHYQRFVDIREELSVLKKKRPAFDPARPVARNVVSRKPVAEGRVFVNAPEAAKVLDFGNALYMMILRLLGRTFGAVEEQEAHKKQLFDAAITLMHQLDHVSNVLTLLPANEDHPGVTAGLSFAVARSMDQLPQHSASWALFRERLREMSLACEHLAVKAPSLARVTPKLRSLAEELWPRT